MHKTWIIVAESSQTRLFAADKYIKTMNEMKTLLSPEARLLEQHLTSDSPGRVFDIKGKGRHAMQKNVSAKQQKNIRFAIHIADLLKHAKDKNEFDDLIVIAAPQFLGLLKRHMEQGVLKSIRHIISKNFAKLKLETIHKRIVENINALPE